MRAKLSLVAIAVALAALGGWWWTSGRMTEVAVVSPVRGTAVEIVYATGAVEPVRWSKVTSLVRQRIVDICNCENKAVKRGDVLARLDDKEIRASLHELRAREDFAKREVARTTELIGRGAVTTQAHEKASSDLRQIQGLMLVLEERVDQYTITSPMDGIVLRQDGEVGEIVEAGAILFRVGVPKPLEVEAEVNEEDIPRVAVGQLVLFRTDAFPGRRIEGKVRDITPMGNPVTKTYRVRFDLPDDTPLRIGMSVEANIVTGEKENALLIPTAALTGSHVFIVDGDRARRREVKIGIKGTRATEILEGLDVTDRVISPAVTSLRDGAPVRLRPGAKP
ncbi:MAG: efflux RND transporter periplasmic adaptor subunit [Pseudorhodoplanes sp.]